MKQQRILLIITLVISVSFLALWTYPKLENFYKVDRCLDAGGRWNETLSKCEYQSTSEVILTSNDWCKDTPQLAQKVDLSKVRKVKLSNINGPHYLTAEEWNKLRPQLEVAKCANGLLFKPSSLTIEFELENGVKMDAYFKGHYINFDHPGLTGSFELKENLNMHNF